MITRLVRATPLLLLCALLAPAPSQAQVVEADALDVRIFGHGGAMFPIRAMAKSIGDNPVFGVLQATGEIDPAATVGGGIEVVLPNPKYRLRARYETTVGATSNGQLGICGVGLIDELSALCEEQKVDATVQSFGAEFIAMLGRPGQRFRPMLEAGIGLRSYDFSDPGCPPENLGGDDVFVCNLIDDMWENPPSSDFYLNFGAGVQANVTRTFDAYLMVQDWVGSYGGNSGRADGNTLNDLFVSVGLSAKVFSFGN